LVETAQSQARVIEAVTRFDAVYSNDYPDGAEAATLSQIIDAHEQYKGFGETGEFTLARREGNDIVFLLSHRHYDLSNPQPVPFDSELAEPMRRALSGQSGTVVGLDYRGTAVIAAHEPVKGLKLGIVAKIDMAEVRAPFVWAALISLGAALLVILLGSALFVRVTSPMIRRLQELYVTAQQELTDRKRAEEQIRRQQEDLNHAARLSTMGEMATSLAHEINQPLAAIAAYADGAGIRIKQGTAEIESLAEIFDYIAADAHRASGVIRRLRRFVEKRTTDRVPTDINETVREVCRFVGAEASQQQTALHLELPDALPRVPADAVQVQQVILNLIRNALDAMRDAGTMDRRVSIETRETETHGIEVSVQDTGPGIPPVQKDQAFEQFFTSKDDGLGMGLAISKSIIEAHGGRIWFASPLGGGALVHITLPPNATEPDHA
jgi:C4-dicarboxylate-specific signal transduction histidine kinase